MKDSGGSRRYVGHMSMNDPAFIRPPLMPNSNAPHIEVEPFRITERIPYDVWFTDELIRRCRARAAQGYRLSATLVSVNKAEVTLLFEQIEWNGVRFPAAPPADGESK